MYSKNGYFNPWFDYLDHYGPPSRRRSSDITPDFARSLSESEYKELGNVLDKFSSQQLFEKALRTEIKKSLGEKSSEYIEKFSRRLGASFLFEKAKVKGAESFVIDNKAQHELERVYYPMNKYASISKEWVDIMTVFNSVYNYYFIDEVSEFNAAVHAYQQKLDKKLWTAKKKKLQTTKKKKTTAKRKSR